jgi:hypothetical protein
MNVMKPTPTPAPQSAAGTCRERRRRERGRRPEWVRPFRRCQRALDSCARLIRSTLRILDDAEECAERKPLRTARNLTGATSDIRTVSRRLLHATRQLAEANECLAREPQPGDAAEILAHAEERLNAVAYCLRYVTENLSLLQFEVTGGLILGELVPEADGGLRRPRIILAPRPVPVRAFLAARQRRAVDRIASILSRRRRTPRPAAVRVPRRSHTGRAPPLSSICLL